MNAKKSFRNVLANILNQVITLALGIIIPRLVLVNLGSEANGLLSSVNQVLAYVALLEAGIGTASLQALYGPTGSGDHSSICQILSATHRYYKRTGTLYFFAVLLISVVFPFTLQTEISRTTVMLVVLLSGLPGVVNYYFQGKYRILLQAEGKNYVLVTLATIINILVNVTKIILLLCGYGIVALQTMHLIFNLIQMVYIVFYIKKHYKWIDLSVKPDYAAISQSKNVLVHQVSEFVFNNTDVLLLTYFCGLSTVSVYSMYTMLFGIVSTLITNFSGVTFVLGQTYHKDINKYMRLRDVYELYNMTLTFALFCVANILVLPFLQLYTAGVNGISYVDEYLPILFICTYLLMKGRTSSQYTINHAQHFRQTQWHAVAEMIINLTVSVLCVSNFGIYGVLMGTIAALLFRANAMILYANKCILHCSPWVTYRRWLLNLVLFIGVTVAAKWVFSYIALDSYLKIIFWAVICCVTIVPLFFVVVSIFDKETYRYAKELLMPYLKAFISKYQRPKREEE